MQLIVVLNTPISMHHCIIIMDINTIKSLYERINHAIEIQIYPNK